MTRAVKILSVCAALIALFVLVGAIIWLSAHRGKVVAESKHEGWHHYTVLVTQRGNRYTTQLLEERRVDGDLFFSSYEFFEGSVPIENVTIRWLSKRAFVVSFGQYFSLNGTWDDHRSLVWGQGVP